MSHDQNPYQPYGQQLPGSQYSTPPGQGPPPLRSPNRWMYAVGVVALLGGGLLAACCCGAVFFGKSVMEEELTFALRDNPTIRQHIGEIQSVSYNLSATTAHEDMDSDVFDIVGSKGSGEIIAYLDDEMGFISGTLRMANGDEYELP